MRGAESVIHIDIAQLGELFGEVGVVLFFFLMKTQILQQHHVAIFHRCDSGFDFGTDAIAGESHRLVQQLREVVGARLERELCLRPRLGPAKVAHQHQPPAAIDYVLDCRDGLSDPSVVLNRATLKRHVKVNAH